MNPPEILPYPRSVQLSGGLFMLPERCALHLDPALDRDRLMLPITERLQSAAAEAGVSLELITGPPDHPRPAIRAMRSTSAPAQQQGYLLEIGSKTITLHYRDEGGL